MGNKESYCSGLSVANFVFISMSLLYQQDNSQGYICGELNNFDDKNLKLLFCTGDLERSYAGCHLGLFVCCSVVLVQIIKILNWIGNEGWE